MAKQKIRLRADIASRLKRGSPEENDVTLKLAIHFKCSQENVRKLIATKSDKLPVGNYAVKIKEFLKLNPKIDISESYE